MYGPSLSKGEEVGCLIALIMLVVFALVGFAAAAYGLWWVWSHVDFKWIVS